MWLLGVRPPKGLRTHLPPGRYLLPWWYDDDDVRRLRLVLRWFLKGVVYGGELTGRALLELAQDPRGVLRRTVLVVTPGEPRVHDRELEDAAARVDARYLFLQLRSSRVDGYGWRERYLKPPLVDHVRHRVGDPLHPLAALNIGALPVDEAATLTSDPAELLFLLDRTVRLRLAHVEHGVAEADYERSLYEAAGERLAQRLLDLDPVADGKAALHLVLTAGAAGDDPDRFRAGAEALNRAGLGRFVSGHLSLGPLARGAGHPPLLGALEAQIPRAWWTDEARAAIRRLRPPDREASGAVSAASTARAATPAFGVPGDTYADVRQALPADDVLEGTFDVLARLAALPRFREELPGELRHDVARSLRNVEDSLTREEDGRRRWWLQLLGALLRLHAARGPGALDAEAESVETLQDLGEQHAPDWFELVQASAELCHAATLMNRFRGREDLAEAEQLIVGVAEALAGRDAPGHLSRLGTAYHHLGSLSRRLGHYDEALGHYRASYELADRLGDEEGMAHLCQDFGAIAHVRGRYDEAEAWLEKARAVHERLDNRPGLASTYHQLGLSAHQRGDGEAAARWQRRAAVLNDSLGNRAGLAAAYHHLGMVAQDVGDGDEALAWYGRARDIYQQLGDQSGVANVHHQLGTLAQERGRFEDAEAEYRRALAMSRAATDRVGAALALSQLGSLYVESDRKAEGIAYQAQALLQEDDVDTPWGRLGVARLQKERDSLAEEPFRLALATKLGPEDTARVEAMLPRTPRPSPAPPPPDVADGADVADGGTDRRDTLPDAGVVPPGAGDDPEPE